MRRAEDNLDEDGVGGIKDGRLSVIKNRAKTTENPSDMRSLVNAAINHRVNILNLKQNVVEHQMNNLSIGEKYSWLEKCLE